VHEAGVCDATAHAPSHSAKLDGCTRPHRQENLQAGREEIPFRVSTLHKA